MNAELLYEALNDRHSLEQLSINDLGRLVSSHPYFSIGQLLLAKKQRQVNDTDSYQHQREHLHAFFRNPWWLYYQLELADHTATPAYIAQVPYRFEAAPFESIAAGRSAAESAPTPSPWVAPEPVTPPPVHPGPEAIAPPAPEAIAPPAPETIAPPAPEAFAPVGPEATRPVGQEATRPLEPVAPLAIATEESHRHGFVPWPGMEEEEDEMEIPTLMGATVVEHEAAQAHEAVAAPMPEPAAANEAAEEIEPFLPYMVTSAVEDRPEEPAVTHAAAQAEPEPAAAAPVEPAAVHVAPEPAEMPAAAAELEPAIAPVEDFSGGDPEGDPDDTDAPEALAGPVDPHESPAPPPAFPTAEPAPFPFSLTPLAHDFTFEPLHTVDYFASQGIKLDLDDQSTDNFTRHLRSFTEWLKTMKRIHPMDGRHTDLDAATEAEIQQLASSANQQRDAIVTESMAHVWVLQGKIHKAVEVYNKLSLQHPEKRAYFAAKIEQLNKL